VRLCIDPDDLEVEPLDLDDLAGETPLRDVSAPLPGVVTRGQAVALSAADDAHDAVPVIACDAAACNGAVLVVDRAGKEIARATLPDLAGLPRGTAVEFSVALADVDGDGASELWVGAEVSERAQKTPGTAPAQTPAQTPAKKPAKPRIRRTVLAVFATPDLTLQWSAEIAHQRPGDACEGALYSVDADCDGGGDLLLSRRCGPPGCLGDDGADVDGVPVQREACRDTLAVYIWNPARRSYDARAVQPPSSAGSKP
jgi:hypothetical protein